MGHLMISRRALAKWHSLCVFVNRWALAPGPNSLANSLNTKPEDSDKGFKVSAIALSSAREVEKKGFAGNCEGDDVWFAARDVVGGQ